MATGNSTMQKWDEWPCTHACTLIFHIPVEEVQRLVPPPLKAFVDRKGRAQIELGYVRFRGSTHYLPGNQQGLDVPPTEEVAWAIRVVRKEGRGYAFLAMGIAANNSAFLEFNKAAGFAVLDRPARFRTNLDRREYRAEDESGPICTLRHEPKGGLPLPFYPITTEVWTEHALGPQRRLFKWSGPARFHRAIEVASSLHDHRFFRGVRVSRANPLPVEVFTSLRVAKHAAQRFTFPDFV